MNIDIQKVLDIYKEELMNVKHENILLKAIQIQLEEEIKTLREQLNKHEG